MSSSFRLSLEPVRAALIGTGTIAADHAKGYRANTNILNLAAVQDIDVERAKNFAATHGIPNSYPDLDSLLHEQKPEFVSICTPPGVHAALSMKCMEADAYVMCEKPLCASLSEFDAIAAVEKKTGRFCASVFQMRYASSGRHIRSVLQGGIVGRPLVAVCHTQWYRSEAYYAVPWRGKWDNELGGPTVGHGIHAMDQLLFLLGPWKSVRAVARTLDRKIEVEDVSMAIVEFESGCLASIVNSTLCPREETRIRIDAQLATIELIHTYGYGSGNWRATLAPGASPAIEAKITDFPPADVPTSHGAQLAALVRDMRLGTTPVTAGVEARNTIELLTAIYKSAITGTAVERGTIVSSDPFYTSFHGGRNKL